MNKKTLAFCVLTVVLSTASLTFVQAKTTNFENSSKMEIPQGQKPNKKPDAKPGGDKVPSEFESSKNNIKKSDTGFKDKRNNSKDEYIYYPSVNMNRQSPYPPANYKGN